MYRLKFGGKGVRLTGFIEESSTCSSVLKTDMIRDQISRRRTLSKFSVDIKASRLQLSSHWSKSLAHEVLIRKLSLQFLLFDVRMHHKLEILDIHVNID